MSTEEKATLNSDDILLWDEEEDVTQLEKEPVKDPFDDEEEVQMRREDEEEEIQDRGKDEPEEKDEKEVEEEVEDDNPLSIWYNYFTERGILKPSEKTPETEEEFMGMFENLREELAEEVKEQLWNALPSQEMKDLLEYGLSGGSNIDEFKQTYQDKPVEVEDVDDLSIDQKKGIINRFFKMTTDLSDDEINEIIEGYEDTDKLDDKAKSAVSKINDKINEQREEFKAKQKKAEEEQRKAAKETRELLMTKIEKEESIRGYKLSKKEREKLKPFIFQPVKLDDGTVMSMFNYKYEEAIRDPEKFLALSIFLMNDASVGEGYQKEIETKTKGDMWSKLKGKGTPGAPRPTSGSKGKFGNIELDI